MRRLDVNSNLQFMGTVLVLLIGFFAFEAIGYGIHRLLHSRWAGALNRAHMTHHIQIYPPDKFLSHRYIPAKDTGAVSDAWRFAVPAVALSAALLYLLPPHLSVPLVSELALVGWLNATMHDALHIRNHWLERFRLFKSWRRHHTMHHIDMGMNFGIMTFASDRVMRTYWKPGTTRYLTVEEAKKLFLG